MPLQAFIADFGGVLTNNFLGVLRDFARTEGLQEDALVTEVTQDATGRQLLADVEAGHVSQREFQAQLAPRLGVKEEGLVERVCKTLAPDTAMISAAAGLRQRGIRCAVLSNSWGTDPYDPYAAWQLERAWDVVIYSHEVRLRKPSPSIYALAAERLGVAPADCVYVDDTADHLPAAERLGMTVLHHTDSEATLGRLEALFGIDLH